MASLLESFKCFALRTKHGGKYLQSVYREKAGGSRIEASADAVAGNARTRFFVEPSEGEDGLVHVRCIYNNKYWVAVKDSVSSRWIIGTADEPDEDLSSPSCTLFAATDLGDSIRFRHSGQEKYACIISTDDIAKPYLQLRDVADDQENTSDVFTVLGLSQQKELPKYVAFKQSNGKYLGVVSSRKLTHADIDDGPTPIYINPYAAHGLLKKDETDYKWLVFHTEDKGDESVMFTVFTNDDGTVRIKSSNGEFWRRNPGDNIGCDVKEISNSEADSLFKVINGDGFIALQNLGNNKFCKILRADAGYEYLSAVDGSMSQYTRLQFDEPFVRREIYDVKFHIKEARIYDTEVLTWMGDVRTNNSDSEIPAEFTFERKTEIVTKWQTSVSSKSAIESSISIGIGEAPRIVQGEVKLSTESTSSESKETSESKMEASKFTQPYKVPPRKRMAAQLVAKRSTSDVPYSYKERIVLTNGEEKNSVHDDGIYTVANNYNFSITVTDDEKEIKKMLGEN